MRDIPGFEGRYAVTEDGKVWSYPKIWQGHSHNGMFLKESKMGYGYLGVSVIINGKSRYFGVHRLVAFTYIPNPDGKSHVHHKDHNKHNNHYNNLEWVTSSENTMFAANIGLMSRRGEVNGHHKYSQEIRDKVLSMSKEGYQGKQISREMHIPPSSIYKIINDIQGIKKDKGNQT